MSRIHSVVSVPFRLSCPQSGRVDGLGGCVDTGLRFKTLLAAFPELDPFPLHPAAFNANAEPLRFGGSRSFKPL